MSMMSTAVASIDDSLVEIKHPIDEAPQMDEQVLITKMKCGDINAYTPIMQRYNQRLFRIARSIVKDDAQAMDIVQEAHIKAFLKITELKDPKKLSSWLGMITRNEALTYLRATKKEVSMSDTLSDLTTEQELSVLVSDDDVKTGYPDSILANKQLKILLNRYIDNLPQNFRTVFILRGVEHLSVKETALIEDIKEETVKTRYHRAKKILQKNIMDYLKNTGLNVYEFGGKHCEIIVKNVHERLHNELNLKS